MNEIENIADDRCQIGKTREEHKIATTELLYGNIAQGNQVT